MKTKLTRLVIVLAWLALPALVQAQFTFTTNNGAITITGYNTAAGLSAVVPAATNGYPVTSIGDYAFGGANLASVTIPGSVTNIADDAFEYSYTLSNITVAAANPAYSSLGGVLFDKAQAILLKFPSSLDGSYIIPGSVTSIGADAFVETALTGVTIPNSVTNIGRYAFAGTLMTTVYFQGNAPPDDGTAFSGDSATAYYLAGTTGWGSMFGSVPAVLWNPQAQALGFTGGQFGFNIAGPTNAVIVVEACTDLAHPVWLPVSTNTLSGLGTSAFSDPTGYPMRFYRFRSP